MAHGREAEDAVVEETFPLFCEHFYDEDTGSYDFDNPDLIESYNVIYVAKDKDVNQNPGHLCNPDDQKNAKDKKHVVKWVTPWGKLENKNGIMKPYGLIGLYGQMLDGDTIDNIPGCLGMGTVAIIKLLEQCSTEAELLNAVVTKWHESALRFNATWHVQLAWYKKYGRKWKKGESALDRNGNETTEQKMFNDGVKRMMAKLKAKCEDTYCNYYHYYPWECYELDEFDCPIWKLNDLADTSDMLMCTPMEAVQEVATLLWIRHYKVDDKDIAGRKAPLGRFREEFNL